VLEYRSAEFAFRTYDYESYQPAAVVNYPNDYAWTRITEYKKLSGDVAPVTTVSYEYPAASGHEYYVVLDKKNIAMRNVYLAKAAELEAAKKFLFVGRLAEYRYYDMDKVIEAVIRKLERCFSETFCSLTGNQLQSP
jgi:UDP-galactopyranose mutase